MSQMTRDYERKAQRRIESELGNMKKRKKERKSERLQHENLASAQRALFIIP